MQSKKPLVAILATTLILTACGGALSSLKTSEKSLYDINEEAGKAAINLAETLNKDASEMPSYETVWNTSRETSQQLAKSARLLKELSLPEETTQIKENSMINLDSTIRIVDKINEISGQARALLIDEAGELDQAARDTQLNEMNTSLSGFRGRLEKSKEKFDNLNTQLLKESATNNKTS